MMLRMRRILRFIPIAMFLPALVSCAGVERAPSQAVTAPLHVEGKFLKDPSGRVVVLRGVNHHGFLDVPDGAWDPPGAPLYSGMGRWAPGTIQETLAEFRRLGFNVVRFHTVVEWWKKDPSAYRDPYRNVTYDRSYRDMMEDTIRWAGEAGLYVIFDFFAMKNVDGRQSGQESLPWPPWGRHPDVVGNRGEFVGLWESVAKRLGRHPNVLFELYNEPHGDAAASEEWFRFVREVLPVIRAHSANLVIVQWDYMAWVNLDFPPPGIGASSLGWIAAHPLDDPHVVYSTHLYRNSGAGGGGSVHRGAGEKTNPWEGPDLEEGLRLMGFDSLQRPLLVTEIGAYLRGGAEDRGREVEWLRNVLALLDARDIGWMGWGWASEEQIDHGMLYKGQPNDAGQVLIERMKR